MIGSEMSGIADSPLLREWHQIAVELAMTEAALTLSASNVPDAARTDGTASLVESARKCYESLQSRRKELRLTPNQAAALDEKLDRIRTRLRFLGEPV
jgi:hypothetical protein